MSCRSEKSFEVTVAREVLSQTSYLKQIFGGRRALVVTTPTVNRLLGAELRQALEAAGVAAEVEVLALGERRKTLRTVERLCELAYGHRLDRRDAFVAFGGGVCCDIVRVASNLYRRGVPYVALPTTLIGQVDAGVGLKGAVNFAGRKNALGCYVPPAAVLVDPSWLTTLPSRQLSAGMAEILKMAVIADPELFETLEAHGAELVANGFSSPADVADWIVKRAIELIMASLEPNCYEDNDYARELDLGHTFSPRLEEASGWRLPHGCAVAVDLRLSCEIGVELGWLGRGDADRIVALLAALGLPLNDPQLSPDLAAQALAAGIEHRAGALNLPVPTAIGSIRFICDSADLPTKVLKGSLRRMRCPASTHASAARV